MTPPRPAAIATLFVAALLVLGCTARPGEPVTRHGDEIVVAGQLFRIGTPVKLWMDEHGYDAYRVESRFNPRGEHKWEHIRDTVDTPNRYGLRYERTMPDEDFERLRGGGWTLEELRTKVDLFVIHYDVCGTSLTCFDVLHDHRCLSVHFMLDIDGTIYQTMDVKERAWHAGSANDRSIGIEIANIGAYPEGNRDVLDQWYALDDSGRPRITLPSARRANNGGVLTPNFVGHPIRDTPVLGTIHGTEYAMYDLTREQYDALAKLTAALSRIFPDIPLVYPTDEAGHVRMDALTEDELKEFRGLIGHYHLTPRKQDPGPAFQWDRVTREAAELLGR